MRTELNVEPYIGVLDTIIRDLQAFPANPTQIATSVTKLNKMFQIVGQESQEMASLLQPLWIDCNKIAADTTHSARARDEALKQRLVAMIQTIRTWQAQSAFQKADSPIVLPSGQPRSVTPTASILPTSASPSAEMISPDTQRNRSGGSIDPFTSVASQIGYRETIREEAAQNRVPNQPATHEGEARMIDQMRQQLEQLHSRYREMESRALRAERQIKEQEAQEGSELKAMRRRYESEWADQRGRLEAQQKQVLNAQEARLRSAEQQWLAERERLIQQLAMAMDREKALQKELAETQSKEELRLQQMRSLSNDDPASVFANLRRQIDLVTSLLDRSDHNRSERTVSAPMVEMLNKTRQMLRLATQLSALGSPIKSNIESNIESNRESNRESDKTFDKKSEIESNLERDAIRPDELSGAICSALPPAGLVATAGGLPAPFYGEVSTLQYQIYRASELLGWQLIYPGIGETADSKRHQWAEADIEITDVPALEGTIASVKRPGIAHHETVIRKAEVKRYLYMAQRPPSEDNDDLLEV